MTLLNEHTARNLLYEPCSSMVIPDPQSHSRHHTFQFQGAPLMVGYIRTITQVGYQSGKLAIPD